MRVTGMAGAAFAIAGGVCALKIGTGCATVLGIDSDRHLAVVDAGSLYPTGWECLGTPDYTDDGGTVTTVKMNFTLLDSTSAASSAGSGTPITGAAIHACTAIDFSCANPYAGATTDDAGAAIFTLPYGFAGFYEVPAGVPNFNPSLFFRPPQYVGETQIQGMAESGDISAAGPVAGVTQEPTLGFAIVSVNDCNGNSAGGIQFQLPSPGTTETIVYLKSSIPDMGATQTDSTTGSALIFNVPVGQGGVPQSLEVSASFASSGAFIRTISGLGRAGWVSYLAIIPDQATRTPFME